MEIRMECISQLEASADIVTAFRVGEVVKQTRLAGTRTFRFNNQAPDPKAFGRVEVFRRIGHAIVSFDEPTRDVKVRCNDADLPNLDLRFSIDGARPASPTKAKAAASVQVQKRKNAAQAYLDQHGIEAALGDVMRDIISNKPKDPFQYLAAQFSKKMSSVVAPEAARGGERVGFGVDFKKPFRGMKADAWSKIYAKFPAAKMTVFGAYYQDNFPSVPAMPGLFAKFDFKIRAYYQEHMLSPPASGMKSLYAKFPQRLHDMTGPPEGSMNGLFAKFPAFQKAKAATTRLNVMTGPPEGSMSGLFAKFPAFQRAKAATTRLQIMTGPPKDSMNGLFAKFPAFQKAKEATTRLHIMTGPPKGSMNGLFAKFPAFQQAEGASNRLKIMTCPPAGSMSSLYAKFPSSQKASSAAIFAKRPSVGTWLQPRLKPRPQAAPFAPCAAAAAAESRAATFTSRPSVATWLQPRRQPKPQAPVAGPRGPAARPSTFQHQPSVGSWLLPNPARCSAAAAARVCSASRSVEVKPSAAAAAASHAKKPSVGTWMIKRAAWHRPVLSFATEVVDKMDKKDLMCAVKQELAAKDHEIEVLRAQVLELRRGSL